MADYVFTLRQNDTDFTLKGANLYASLDATETLSLGVNLSDLSTNQQISNELNAEAEAKTLSFSGNYSWQDWSLSAQYTDIQDSVKSADTNSLRIVDNQSLKTDIISANVTRYWTIDNWQLVSATGLHYNEWQHNTLRRLTTDSPPEQVNEDGQSIFASLTLTFTHYHALTEKTDLLWGAGATWHHLITHDFEDDVEQSNSRPRPRAGNNASTVATGTESYTQINAFASFFWGDNWQLDLTTGIDTEADYNSQYWSLDLSYSF